MVPLRFISPSTHCNIRARRAGTAAAIFSSGRPPPCTAASPPSSSSPVCPFCCLHNLHFKSQPDPLRPTQLTPRAPAVKKQRKHMRLWSQTVISRSRSRTQVAVLQACSDPFSPCPTDNLSHWLTGIWTSSTVSWAWRLFDEISERSVRTYTLLEV
jgi:hypothetical protein